ncbi:tripartite tricarboxylate transporter substrate-binding protein [Streptosporangium sp. CA-135522]|uniref:tripartite tricarboxylate transporter substrate-binding protein n=1 Tax=Streptosporangium sp. CA-135522 TaxID=3240072 RepID=UPI003D919E52
MYRRRFLVLALGLLAAGGCDGGRGTHTPVAGRLTVVAPAARGQGWDRAARALAMVMIGEGMARTVEVSDQPGSLGAAALGSFAAVRGPFTREGRLLLTGMPMIAGVEIANAASVVDSTTPLARLVGDWAALVVSSGSHLRTFEDFAAALRRDPAEPTVGGRMEGGSDHVLYGMIGKCLGVDTRLLDYAGYSGGTEAEQALYDGRVTALLGSARSFVPGIAAGRLRPLVVSSGERIDGIDAPTLMELDVRLEYTDWCGVLGPRGMSSEDRDAAVALCDRLDASPRWRAVCAANGWNRVYLSGEDFRQWLVTETGRTREVLNDLGLLSTFGTSCWGSCVHRPYM